MEFDQYDLNKSCEEIHAGITSHLKVAFDKIVEVTIDGVLGQLIRLRMTEDSLEESTLRKLNFNIEKFVETDENRKKPIRQGLPVFLTGRAPNWLITSLLIPLRNLRTVYVYNQPSEKYICVYDKTPNRKEFGRVLRANKR